MLTKTLLVALALTCAELHATSLSCMFGKKCVLSQGTKIDPDTAIEMLDYCADFTSNGIGRIALKLSLQEVQKRSNGQLMHPLQLAVYAFEKLHESPLKFTRQRAAEDTNYSEIQSACNRLETDFNDSSKWVK